MPKVRERRLSIGILNTDLLCVLCSGYLIDATTITECLHRFCRSCIVKYLKVTQFCPICDVQINQNRPWESLRPDTTIQTLVYKLVPGLYQKEMTRRRSFYAKSDGEPFSSEDAGLLPPNGPLFYSQEDSISLSLEYNEEGDKESDIPKRYLQCPAAVTVRHLKKFLSMKLAIDSQHAVDIIYDGECLPEAFSLMDVAYTFQWKRASPMRFSYRFRLHGIPKSVKTTQASYKLDQQNQSEYLGLLNLNPRLQKSNDMESESSSSELCIASEKETPLDLSSDEEDKRRKLKKEKKFKKTGEKRRKSESFLGELPEIEHKKRRKSLVEDEHLKNEALRKVFTYKEKIDMKRSEEEGKRKKRKKSRHHDGEPKKQKKEPAPPAILSVAKDALKLKVKLAPLRQSPPLENEESKATKERLQNLRAVRKPVQPPKPEIISSSPSLTISKIDGEQTVQKNTLVESKPSLEIMLVKKPEEKEAVLDLSEKSSRVKEVEIVSPKKTTQQSILQIAETLVNRKLTPPPPPEIKDPVVAMRDLKTLSDAAVNILMAAQSRSEPKLDSPLKIPVFPKERNTPIPPVPNLHEIYPRGRGRPLLNGPRPPALIRPGQNQIVRQIPDPFVILNRKNLLHNGEKPKEVPKLVKPDNNNTLKVMPAAKAIVKLGAPVTGIRKIESVAAGLTARANALIDAK